ncbi:MAG: hypothetical protein MMC23_001908 [Stictis urceolatum]|nr:hypothetical protein [Stictis urceolata]
MGVDFAPICYTALALTFSLSLAGFVYKVFTVPTVFRPELVEWPQKEKEQARQASQQEVFLGKRDVDSPYGNTRVYEWGSEDGHKVLFVHGISTPSLPVLERIAQRMVEGGYRVCLYGGNIANSVEPISTNKISDLWGRGCSDAPLGLPYDARLYFTQIQLVLASSPLSWTGQSQSFSMVGYSMGGGLVMSFAAHSPDMITNVVLLAPGGLLRSRHPTYYSVPLRYPQYFPARWIQNICEKLLCGEETDTPAEKQELVADVALSVGASSEVPASGNPPAPSIEAIVRAQVRNHPRFVHSFLSSLKFAPVRGQHEDWRRYGRYLSKLNARGAYPRKVLFFMGEGDPYSPKHEVVPDAAEVLEVNNMHVETMSDGHMFPMTQSEEIAKKIMQCWERGYSGSVAVADQSIRPSKEPFPWKLR